MKKKAAALAALAASVVVVALAAATAAFGAATSTATATGERSGPLTLQVICVELVSDAPKIKDMLWRVHFGYSTTSVVSPEEVEKSEFEDAPGWDVVSGSPPPAFEGTGFDDTGGAAVVAIVVENQPGYGDESIKWDVDLSGPHEYGPKKARFDGDTMGASSCPGGSAAAEVAVPQEPVRAIYCSVAGNTVNGVAVPPGTALNLYLGQPGFDSSYKGATPAFFVEGIGATCDAPPAGYSFKGSTYVDGAGVAHGLQNAIYPFFEKS
jgi:hypothetical protein